MRTFRPAVFYFKTIIYIRLLISELALFSTLWVNLFFYFLSVCKQQFSTRNLSPIFKRSSFSRNHLRSSLGALFDFRCSFVIIGKNRKMFWRFHYFRFFYFYCNPITNNRRDLELVENISISPSYDFQNTLAIFELFRDILDFSKFSVFIWFL